MTDVIVQCPRCLAHVTIRVEVRADFVFPFLDVREGEYAMLPDTADITITSTTPITSHTCKES